MGTKTDDALKGVAKAMDEILEDIYGVRMGFALMVYPFGNEDRAADYISNGDRGCMIKALRETADKIERNETIPTPIGTA